MELRFDAILYSWLTNSKMQAAGFPPLT